MGMATEPDNLQTLNVSREPKAPKRAGDPGSMGDKALKDAILILVVAWALLFLLAFSLRKYNV